jgi:hypothetical protein
MRFDEEQRGYAERAARDAREALGRLAAHPKAGEEAKAFEARVARAEADAKLVGGAGLTVSQVVFPTRALVRKIEDAIDDLGE